MVRSLLVLIVLVSCVESAAVPCGDRVCPPSAKCDEPSGMCIPAGCGDLVKSASEECDGTDFGDQDCTSFGYYAAILPKCTTWCAIDTSMCGPTCGDRIINGPEQCDGIPPPGQNCLDFGFDLGRLSCSPACAAGFAGCNKAGWQPAPGGALTELHGLWGSDPSHMFAVGLNGVILRVNEGVWLPMASPTTNDLFAVWGTDDGNAFAVGAAGTIVRYDRMTDAWTVMTSNTTRMLYSVSGSSPTNVYAVGEAGTVVQFNGTSWTESNAGTTETLRDVLVVSGTVIVVGDTSTVRRRQGASWTAAGPTIASAPINFRAIAAVPDGSVFLTGRCDPNKVTTPACTGSTAAVLYRINLADQTPTWTSSNFPTAFEPTDLWGTASDDLFIVGPSGQIVHYDGQYTFQPTNSARSVRSIWGFGPALVYAATRGGDVLEYFGTVRTQTTVAPSIAAFLSVWQGNGGAIAVGTSGTIVRYDGATWGTPTSEPGPSVIHSVWGAGSQVFIAATDQFPAVGPTTGYVRRSDNGAAFAGIATGKYLAVGGSTSPLHIYAVGMDGIMIHSLSGAPGTWTPQTSNTNEHLRAVWATSDGTAFFVVGTNGTIVRGDGTTWMPMSSGVTVALNSVWGTAANDVFAVGDQGTIVHFDGTSWRRMTSNTGQNLLAISGPSNPTSRSDIFAAGTSVALHFDGASWSPMSPATARTKFAVSVSHEDVIFADQDGLIDQVMRTCVPLPESRCSDPWDNDCDGLLNCDDEDCRGEATCIRGGVCDSSGRVTCETTTLSTYSGIGRLDEVPCLTRSTPGPEFVRRFVADSTGPVTVTISNALVDLDLAIITGNAATGACDLNQCTPATTDTKTVTFTAVANQPYYVLVDGLDMQASDFTLSISCP